MRMMRNEDEDDEDEDEDEEDEDEDENEDDDDPLSYQLEISSRGRLGGDQGGSNLGLPESFRVSSSPAPCLFLAKARATSASTASFRGFSKNVQRPAFFLMFVQWKRTVGNIFSLKENGKTLQIP